MPKCRVHLSPLAVSLLLKGCCLLRPNHARARARAANGLAVQITTSMMLRMMKPSSNHLVHLSPPVVPPVCSQTRHATPNALSRAATATPRSVYLPPNLGIRLKVPRRHRPFLPHPLLKSPSRRLPCHCFRDVYLLSTLHHPWMAARCRNRTAIL